MALDLLPDKLKRVPGTRNMRVVSRKPYIRLSAHGGPPIFLQAGKTWGEGGILIKATERPEWFQEELQKVPQTQLEQVDWNIPGRKGARATANTPPPKSDQTNEAENLSETE